MNTYRLKVAVKVAETQSISAAARALFLSQPTVSEMLRALEEEIGFTIFNRTNRTFEVTEKGRAFLRHAALILEQEEQIEDIRLGRDQCCLRLVSFGSHRVQHAFLRFCQIHADCDRLQLGFETAVLAVQQSISRLRDGKADVVLALSSPQQLDAATKNLKRQDFGFYVLGELTLVLIVSQNHPLATADLTADELRRHIILLPDDLSIANQLIPQEIMDEVNWDRQIHVLSQSMRLRMLSEGIGFTVSAQLTKNTMERWGLVCRPFRDLKAVVLCICSRQRREDPFIRELVGLIREEYGF